jgi:hypothetical protein
VYDEAVSRRRPLNLQRSREFGNTIAVKHARGYFASKVNLPGALSQDLAQKMAIANNRA